MTNPKHWMQTFTKRPVRFDAMHDLEIDIEDIILPLSRLPRFCGHTSRPLTVAEHSLAVQAMVLDFKASPITQLHALLHDAHEAFTNDIPAPFKRFVLADWGFDIDYVQAQMQFNIMAALGIPPLTSIEDAELISRMDGIACKVERDIYMKSPLQWDVDVLDYPKNYTDFYPERQWTTGVIAGNFRSQYKDLINAIRQVPAGS